MCRNLKKNTYYHGMLPSGWLASPSYLWHGGRHLCLRASSPSARVWGFVRLLYFPQGYTTTHNQNNFFPQKKLSFLSSVITKEGGGNSDLSMATISCMMQWCPP